MDRIRRDPKAILFFLLPGLLIYTLLVILPIIGTFAFSFAKWNGIQGSPIVFVGLRNYRIILTDPEFWLSIKNILWFLVLTMVLQLPLGMLLALFLTKNFKGFKFFKATYFVPQVISSTVIGLVWYFILMPGKGVLDTLLTNLGLDFLIHNWLVDKNTAMTTIILVNAWAGIGFHMTVHFASITSISEEVLEAAMLDGAVGWNKITKIIIPLDWEAIRTSIIIIVTAALKTFDLVYVMTGGGPNGLTNVPSTLMYREAFQYTNFGLGSTIAVCIFVMSVIITVLCMKVTQREVIEQ